MSVGMSLIPFNRVFRAFPNWLKRAEVLRLSNLLWEETMHAVPSAGKNAARSALRFIQQI